jgi:hypothetical protein
MSISKNTIFFSLPIVYFYDSANVSNNKDFFFSLFRHTFFDVHVFIYLYIYDCLVTNFLILLFSFYMKIKINLFTKKNISIIEL